MQLRELASGRNFDLGREQDENSNGHMLGLTREIQSVLHPRNLNREKVTKEAQHSIDRVLRYVASDKSMRDFGQVAIAGLYTISKSRRVSSEIRVYAKKSIYEVLISQRTVLAGNLPKNTYFSLGRWHVSNQLFVKKLTDRIIMRH